MYDDQPSLVSAMYVCNFIDMFFQYLYGFISPKIQGDALWEIQVI